MVVPIQPKLLQNPLLLLVVKQTHGVDKGVEFIRSADDFD
jgi:hypothetical protein